MVADNALSATFASLSPFASQGAPFPITQADAQPRFSLAMIAGAGEAGMERLAGLGELKQSGGVIRRAQRHRGASQIEDHLGVGCQADSRVGQGVASSKRAVAWE